VIGEHKICICSIMRMGILVFITGRGFRGDWDDWGRVVFAGV
jgi:hypothetical protein